MLLSADYVAIFLCQNWLILNQACWNYLKVKQGSGFLRHSVEAIKDLKPLPGMVQPSGQYNGYIYIYIYMSFVLAPRPPPIHKYHSKIRPKIPGSQSAFRNPSFAF